MRWPNVVHSLRGISAIRSLLDLHRVGVHGQAEAPAEPADVRVDRDAGDGEGVAEDHVGRLAADAGQLHQLLHRRGHLAAVLLDELPAAAR